MITHNISLDSFVPHGKVTLKMDNGELVISPKTMKESKVFCRVHTNFLFVLI